MSSRKEYIEALGPLGAVYTLPEVTEIMVDSPDRILVEIKGQLQVADIKLESTDSIVEIIRALQVLTGDSGQTVQTIYEFSMPGGEARGIAVLPPTASAGPVIVIRKLLRSVMVTWEKLVEWGCVSTEAVDFLIQALAAPVNILIAGGTGSGKTTIANRVIELIPPDQRVIIAENAHEIQAIHPGSIYLEAGGQRKIMIEDLIVTASKMRPDWLVIGELLGAEAMKAVDVFGRGYSGITTIHAESVEDALARLEAMCLTANLGLGLGEIRNLVAGAFRLVLYQRRMPDGKRKITDIVELGGLEEGQYVLNRLFRYYPKPDRLEATGLKPGWEV